MKKITTGEFFYIFEVYLSDFKKQIELKANKLLSYDKSIITDRIFQKITFIGMNHFVNETRHFKDYDDIKLKRLGPFKISDSKQISLSFNYQLRCFAEFSYEWLLNLMAILHIGKQNLQASTLVYGIGKESIFSEGSDNRFIQFLSNNKISPLSDFNYLIVQSAADAVSTSDKVFYAANPLRYLIANAQISTRSRLKTLLKHLMLPFNLIICFFSFRMSVLIFRDFSYMAITDCLFENSLIKEVCITNSNYADQPLWMRRLQYHKILLHKIHYSQNNRQIITKGNPTEIANPCLKLLVADIHWVWSDDYADFIHCLYPDKKVCVVGPIMFYNYKTEISTKSKLDQTYNICLFDVTPIYDSVAHSIGIYENYYGVEILNKFLLDIVLAKNTLESRYKVKIKLKLKHKRGFNKNHHPNYIQLCNDLYAKNEIIAVNYEENIFQMIEKSDLTISIPYTSTAQIGCLFHTEALYYDPTAEVLLHPGHNKNISIIHTIKDLENAISRCLGLKN